MKQIFAIVTVILATALFAAAQTPAEKQAEQELVHRISIRLCSDG